MRRWYEVRIRESGSPCKTCKGRGIQDDGRPCKGCMGFGYHGVKKSKFFKANSSGEAAKCYTGSGTVMHTEKVSREKLLGVGEFFKLGDSLLQDLRKEERKADRYARREREQAAYHNSRARSSEEA